MVEFHVTSLDVIHSYSPPLGVKADANRAWDNIAFAKPLKEEIFEVHWEGGGCGMAARSTTAGRRQRRPTSKAGSKNSRTGFAATTKVLPPYSTTYSPEPTRRGEPARERVETPTPAARPLWRRLVGFNLLAAVVLGVGGFYLGWYAATTSTAAQASNTGSARPERPRPVLVYILCVVGFLIGLGFANYPFAPARDAPPRCARRRTTLGRYFGLCTDHKVVGNRPRAASACSSSSRAECTPIRTECYMTSQPSPARPVSRRWSPSMHDDDGDVHLRNLGLFANSFLPLLIGARRTRFPRIESLTFPLLMAAGFILLLDDLLLRRLPDRLDAATSRCNDQAVSWACTPTSSSSPWLVSRCACWGVNMMATIITMRAPGLTWSRLPIFIWAVFSTSVLSELALLMLVATLAMSALDRTIDTSFFVPGGGGSSSTSMENPLLVLRPPRGLHLALPFFGISLQPPPVFTRKPLWGYRLADLGHALRQPAELFVWQHNPIVSGINADLRPLDTVF